MVWQKHNNPYNLLEMNSNIYGWKSKSRISLKSNLWMSREKFLLFVQFVLIFYERDVPKQENRVVLFVYIL